MTITKQKSVAVGTLIALVATTFGGVLATPAQAGSKSWKNYALGGAAVTGYGLLQHNKGLAIAGGVGTLYAYSRYRSARKREKRQEAWRQHEYRLHHQHHWHR